MFEFLQRSPLALFVVPFAGVLVWVAMAFIRPFKWSHLFFTYVIPLIPLVACFDGMVSCIRTYSPEELRRLVEGLPDRGYTWDIGHESALPFSPIPVTYLIGCPSDDTDRCDPAPRRVQGALAEE